MLQLLALAVVAGPALAAPLVRVSRADMQGVFVYRTVAAARDALRAQKASGGLPPGDITVALDSGVHSPFALDARDSGTTLSRITYRPVAAR